MNKPDQWGLGLTARSLNAMLKYPWLRGENKRYEDKWGAYDTEQDEFLRARYGHAALQRSLEAEIMDWADDVTFAVHDLEDFFRAGLIPLDQIVANEREKLRFRSSFFNGNDPEQGLRNRFEREGITPDAIDDAFAVLFEDVFADTDPFSGSRDDRAQLKRRSSFLISEYDREVKYQKHEAGRFSMIIPAAVRAQVTVLKGLTWHYVINRPSLAVIQEGQRTIVKALFGRFASATEKEEDRAIFPGLERDLLDRTTSDVERLRIVADFLSGLTEPLVYELHHRLTGVTIGSILDSAARATL